MAERANSRTRSTVSETVCSSWTSRAISANVMPRRLSAGSRACDALLFTGGDGVSVTPPACTRTPHPTPRAGHAEAGRGAEGHGDVEGACRPSAGACPVRLLDVTGLETVLQPPRHRLGPGGDADLAVGRANVGLDRVEAET